MPRAHINTIADIAQSCNSIETDSTVTVIPFASQRSPQPCEMHVYPQVGDRVVAHRQRLTTYGLRL